jgi:hypothetical protein
MPYNSFMPNYNPYVQQYQQMLQPQVQPQPQQNNGLTWVQGIEGAKSHFVSPGQSALLMDSESNSFFIKTADASGMPMPLRVFDYKERTAQQAPQQPTVAVTDTSGYITREEFEARIAEITATTERTDINAE